MHNSCTLSLRMATVGTRSETLHHNDVIIGLDAITFVIIQHQEAVFCVCSECVLMSTPLQRCIPASSH